MPTINKKDTWDLSLLYKNDTDPKIEADLKKYRANCYKFIDKWSTRQDYLTDSTILLEALTDYDHLLNNGGILGEVGYYFSLRSAQEETNPKLKARLNQITELATKIENDLQFFTLRLAKVPSENQQEFLRTKDLAFYHHFLDRLFADSKYLLSEPEEKILNLKSTPAHSAWVQMTSSILAKESRKVFNKDGKLVDLPLSDIISLSAHPKPKVRHKAVVALNDILSKNADIAEAELNAILGDKKINDELRNLPRPDTSRHLADDVSAEMVDTLIKTVKESFVISQKYYQLKAKLFKQKTLQYHERNVPYGKTSTNFTFKQAVDLVHETFKDIDSEFADIFQQFIKNKQIDIYPYQGKAGGAFCAYNLPTSPVYILLNHTNTLNDVLTLAHEAGHGINDELMRQKQSALYFGTPTVTAEVASTFMEDFVLAKLMSKASDEEKLSLMMTKLNDDISTIIRQVAAYSFEQDLHRAFRTEGYLSKERIGQIFQTNMSAYMGKGVEQNPGSANWWIYWSHFRNFFYVYSYASGLLISKSLQARFKADRKFITKIKTFLQVGTSASPINIFRELNIDVCDQTFWQAGLQEIADLLKDTEQLAKKLGKI